jgi:inosine-uridine nucleoside N-ribohydrolase
LTHAAIPRIWVDTDVALGAQGGDVDDGFALAALLAAHRRGAIELLGISTVFGNSTAAVSRGCAQELLGRAASVISVVAGAERPEERTAASDAIARLPPGTRLLCLGPLTNVAMACRGNPNLAPTLDLRAVGANLSSRGFLPPLWPFEFNFARDAASARAVLALAWKSLTLYPLDVVRRLTAGGDELLTLRRLGPLGEALDEGSRRWLARARWRYPLRHRFPLWDLPAALDVLDLLHGRYAVRRPARSIGRFLEARREFRFLDAFEAEQAWRSFLELLAAVAPA